MEFNKEGIDIQNYRHWKESFSTGMNVIITIDSVMRLMNIDFSEYVVFLDEYNSLIDYLISCPNLRKVRCIVFKMLLKIISEAKQVIAVDADIHSCNLKILEYCKLDFLYIKNEYLHNRDNAEKPVEASEIFNFKDLLVSLKS